MTSTLCANDFDYPEAFDGADLVKEYASGHTVSYYFDGDRTTRIVDSELGELVEDYLAPDGIFYASESGEYYTEPTYDDDGNATYFQFEAVEGIFFMTGGHVPGSGGFTRIFHEGLDITFRFEASPDLLFSIDVEAGTLHITNADTGEHLGAFPVPEDLLANLATPDAGLSITLEPTETGSISPSSNIWAAEG